GEVIVAANLCFEPVVVTLLRRELGTRAAAANGDTVTPVLARVETQEWEWSRAWTVELIRFLLDDPEHGAANRELISDWVRKWLPLALDAALALAPLAEQIPVGIDEQQAVARVSEYAGAMLEQAGLPELCSIVDYEPVEEPAAAAPRRRTRPPKARRTAPPPP